MSHRLQILLDEDEFAEIRAVARRRRLTVSEYVRTVLRDARLSEPGTDAGRKLLVVREASGYAYPTANPDEMEEQIRRGYLDAP